MGNIWMVRENLTNWLNGFDPNTLPEGLGSQVQVVTRKGEIGLVIGGVIGSIPLENGDTLHITPKVGEMNYFRMLLTAEGLLNTLDTKFEDLVGYGHGEGESFPRLIARSFFKELIYIQSSSLRFQRKKVIKRGEFAEGRIHILPTVIGMRLRNERPIVYDSSIRDYDTPENRVLAAASVVAHEFLGTLRADTEIKRSLFYWQRLYSPRILRQDLLDVNIGLSQGKFFGSRGYYVKALTLAKLILSQEGITQGKTASFEGEAILVNTADLFEKYLRSVLSKRYGPEGIIVTKGSTPTKTLYTDGSYSLNPDVVFARGNKSLSIGDAKYKDTTSGDHYQLSIYMDAHKVRHGFLIFPLFDGELPQPVVHKTADGRLVYEIALPLMDLDAAENILNNLHAVVRFPRG